MKKIIRKFIKEQIKNLAEAEVKGDVVNLHYKIDVYASPSDGDMSSVIDYVENNEVVNKYNIKVEVGALESGPKEDESSVYVKFTIDRRKTAAMTAIRLLRDVVIEFIEKKIGAVAVDIEARDFKPDGPSDDEYDQMAQQSSMDDRRQQGMDPGLEEAARDLGYLDEIGNFHDPRMSSGNFDHLTPEKEEQDSDVKSINMVYTDDGRFYGFNIYSEPGLKGQREKLSFRADVDNFLRSKGIKIEIPQGYDEDILDQIVNALRQQGIEAQHNDYMDVSEGDVKEEKSKEDQLKIARAAFEKAEMNGDIRGQELALAAIDLIKNGPMKGLSKPSRLKESKLLDRIKEKPTVEERTAVLKYWLAKRTSNSSSKSGTQFPNMFSLTKENYEGNDPLILSYIEKMDQDIPMRILNQEGIFFKGELIRMINHPDDQPYIQDFKNTLEMNRTDPFGNKLTPQNHDFIADFVKANPDLAELKTLKEMASELGYLGEEEENLKEYTISGGQEAARNYPKTEDPGDMFAQKEVEELLPQSFASRNQELKARLQAHANWVKQDRFNNTFVHVQSNTVTDGNNTYRVAMSQHYNGNYTDFKNPKFTEIRVKELDDEFDMEKDLGYYIVDTTALMQDLKQLKTIERVS